MDVSLQTGIKGRFEVTVDDRLIFSKANSNRFPEDGEILRLAEPILGRPIDWR